MKKCLLKLLVLLLASAPAYAQNVTGRVTNSADGSALPGVSVVVKGTTTGTTTDGDGTYTLSVSDPANSTLVFSFIGFATQEIALGNKTTVNVTLVEDISQLGEVVVTALGIEREKRSLGYTVQEVDGKAFTQAREPNLINNLQGRVAGVQIYKGGTGPGGSSRIVIRGSNSLRGADAPLVVVDGIPFDNFNSANNQSEYGSFDLGQGIAQINPDDIETLTVLKGPEAGALYGNRGANGVILITTKKGVANRGLGINVNSNLTFENPLIYPEMQNEYGQGGDGVFNTTSQSSWGPRATGQSVTDWTGESRPMTIDPDDLKNFLETGRSFTNSVDLSGGSDKTTFRLGYTNFDNKGLLPNTSIKRNMGTLRLTSKLTDKFSADGKVSYSRQEGLNRPATSGSPSNIFSQYMGMPRSIHFEDMNPWMDNDGAQVLWMPTAYSTLRNPYWVLNEDQNRDVTDRFLTMAMLEYRFNTWLKAHIRHGMDRRYTFIEARNAYGIRNPGDGSLNFNSGYNAQIGNAYESNFDFLVAATKTFGEVNVSVSGGGNRRNSSGENVGGNTNTLDFPNVYTLGTGSNPRPFSGKSTWRVNSLYAFANLAFKQSLFLDISFRNDWSSSLSEENRSFSYPSVSASAIISDLVSLPDVISFAKIRGGFAQTGNSIDPYSLYPTYAIGRGFMNAIVTTPPNTLLDPNILPEKVNSIEVGTDIKFMENRIGLEFAYYKRNTTNQIIPLPVPPATGYNFKIINAGDVENKGFEVVLIAKPLQSAEGLNWDINVNFNRNINTVKELHPEAKRYFLQNDVQSRAIRIVADEGEPMGDIYGRDFERDSQGRILVDPATGLPERSTEKNTLLGNYQPKFTMGIVNNFTFKNVSLGFLIDWRQGGKFYSQSQAFLHANGNAAATVAFREGGYIVPGVNPDGSANTQAITSQEYWTAVAGAEPVASLFIYDATNIRLRELTLSYNFSPEKLKNLGINRLSVGFVGRNLWLIKSDIPGIDPESSFTTTNAQGWENGAYPSIRSLGFNVGVGF